MKRESMPTIVGIHHIPRRSSRRRIELDNGETFSLDAGLLTRHGVCVGMWLDPERLEAMRAEDARLRAKAAAFDFVRVRPYARKELAERLRRKGFDREAVEFALDALERVGLLSDEAFAQAFVASRMRRNPKGRFALERELRRRGIDRETIDRTLATLNEGDEREAALRVARKQSARYRTLPEEVARRRMYQFLLRRGFSYEIVVGVLRTIYGSADVD